jgi:hypothetical protein
MPFENLSVAEFLKLDRETDLLSFVADAYEPFHLTGDPGILEEVVAYIADMHEGREIVTC